MDVANIYMREDLNYSVFPKSFSTQYNDISGQSTTVVFFQHIEGTAFSNDKLDTNFAWKLKTALKHTYK